MFSFHRYFDPVRHDLWFNNIHYMQWLRTQSDAVFLSELCNEVDNHTRNSPPANIGATPWYNCIDRREGFTFRSDPMITTMKNRRFFNYIQIHVQLFLTCLKSADVSKRTHVLQTLEQLFRNFLQYVEENDHEGATSKMYIV